MPKKPHLFIFTAKSCGHCARFKEDVLPFLVEKYGSSQISMVDLDDLNQVVNPAEVERIKKKLGGHPSFHPQVLNLRWAPAIGLVSLESWTNKSGLLKGFIYSGEIDESIGPGKSKNVFRRVKNSNKLDFESIDAWIQQKKRDPFFTNTEEPTQPQIPLLGRSSQITYRHRDVLQ